MTKAKLPAVGIDLGTTYSVVARLDERGRPVTLVNAKGDRLTPSVVLLDGDDVVVGKEAMKAMSTEADLVAECQARHGPSRLPSRHRRQAVSAQGRPGLDSQQAPQRRHAADRAVREDGNHGAGLLRRGPPQGHTGARYMAGCEVLDIINEPTAAAVAFGFQQGFLNAAGSTDRPRRVLVYDLGGGTFDVTVMEIRGSEFLALATDGDVALGGYDWDQRLLNLAADAFQREHGLDLRENAAAAGKLWRECEDAKRTLSARPKAPVVAEYQGRSPAWKSPANSSKRRRRTSWIAPLHVRAGPAGGGLEWSDLERLLLVGGSTRMPMVRAMLQKISGKAPDASVAADEAVAHGAALQAGLILAKRDGRADNFSIRNVNSQSLGVVDVDQQTAPPQRHRHSPQHPLRWRPAQFATGKARPRSILVQIVEGESPSADDARPSAAARWPIFRPGCRPSRRSKVIFNYQADGRLKVRVRCRDPEYRVPRTGSWKPRSSARTASARSTWTPGGSTSRASPPRIIGKKRTRSGPNRRPVAIA